MRNHILTALKGMAMGAADVVPGVSGGTIAFISGIYDKLLDSISSISFKTLKELKSHGFKHVWEKINGTFLVALFGGIIVSLLSLAKIVEWCLANEAIKLWAFFFGLVLASIIYVGKQVDKWSFAAIMGIVAGSIGAYFITILPPLNPSGELWFMFLCGMIAVCAMILPGVSGSFILLVLGGYQTVISALSEKDFLVLGTVAAGCAVGLLAFSRVLKWLFNKFKDVTIAVLTGFLVGSLNKIWPWKNVQQGFVKHPGEEDEEFVAIVENSVMPSSNYSVVSEYSASGEVLSYTNVDPQVIYAVLFGLLGFSIIFILEFAAKRLKSNE